MIYYVSRFIAKMLVAPFVRIEVLRPELGRRRGGWILASNHISHFDPPLVGIAAGRKIDWMGMVELFRQPVFGAWLRAIGTFPVDRGHLDRGAIRVALRRLRGGCAVGMFPEGGIRDGKGSVLEGARLRPGVAGLSQLTGAPVVPCVIMGSDRCYALDRLWRPWRRVPVWIGFGEALSAPGGVGRGEARAVLEERLAEAFRGLAVEMREHFKLREEDLPQAPGRRRGEK